MLITTETAWGEADTHLSLEHRALKALGPLSFAAKSNASRNTILNGSFVVQAI